MEKAIQFANLVESVKQYIFNIMMTEEANRITGAVCLD